MSSHSSAAAVEDNVLASPLLSLILPPLSSLSTTLVELQESQQVLVSTVASKRADLVESSPEWREAQAVLQRIPEYQAKVARIVKQKAATLALAARVERGSAALRAKMEERESARVEQRGADAAGFAAVAEK
jgi:hypothetical protein